MRAVIFDFDGVIHDTFEFHRKSIERFTGISLDEKDFRDMHSGNFFKAIPDAMKNVRWEEYRDFIYPEQSNMKIRKEIKDIIEKLDERYMLYIITSGGTKNVSDFFQNNNITVFREILGLETERSKEKKFSILFRKYGLKADDCIFVTDTLGDILEANKMNISTVAIDSGFQDRKTLEKGKPLKIISDLNELLSFL